jgi:outer membrane lipoprotein carrier protein
MKLDKKGLNPIVIFFLILFSISHAFAHEGIDQFKVFLTTVENAEGDFSQQQIRPPRKGEDKPAILRKSQGHFIFQRPGKFVWETSKPFEQKVIADGEKITLWDKDLNQVTIRSSGHSLQSTPAAILFGGAAIEEKFDLLPGDEKGGMFWFELKPKADMGSEQPYSRIGIGMSKGLPAGIELHDNFGNVILVTLSKIQVNTSLSAKTFKFVPPAGADVLKVQ